MKTIKIKVKPTPESLALITGYQKELEWLWNKCRWVALHNHCIEWYRNAEKKWGVDLEGCIRVPLRFDRRNAWSGASCQIAVGGPYWGKDESVVIQYRYLKSGRFEIDSKTGNVVQKGGKWEPCTKHASKLIDGNKPRESVKPVAHEFIELGGKELRRVAGLDSKKLLNAVRAKEDLPSISIHSDYIGGLAKDFETSWKAYTDTKLSQRHQPRYKDGKESKVSTLCNNQNPPKFQVNQFICAGLKLRPHDRSWQQRMGSLAARSYKLAQKPSGWYLCISAALPSECEKPALTSRRNKASAAAKKGVTGKAAQSEALENSAEYQEAVALLKENAQQIEIDKYLASLCLKLTGHTAGIDPGVKAIVVTSDGAVFRPNVARGRVALHIESLQSRLDGIRESNDRRLKASWRMGRREATKNEIKLAAKISRLHEKGANSSNAFNHKLATRLARTYDVIYWENTQLGNMSKGVDPKLAKDGTHYEQNGAAGKTGLNYAIRHACIGDLKAKVKQRMDGARKKFVDVPAAYSSKKCHACGEIGDRAKQDTFFCLNSKCELHLKKQHADVNAAKNHKKNGEALTDDK